MKSPEKDNFQKGNILVTSLLMLIVMNLLGTSLVQLSVTKAQTTSYKTINSEVFHITDSCINDISGWFGEQTYTQKIVPDFSLDNLEVLYSDADTESVRKKLTGYSYICRTTYLISLGNNAGTVGEEIGNSGGEYNSTSSTTPKDYYSVESSGIGPKGSRSTIHSIISVEY